MMRPQKRAEAEFAPFIVSSSGDFNGLDGNWSTFSLEIGSPAQKANVLPSTSGQVSWIDSYRASPYEDCPLNPRNLNINPPRNCPSLRGIVPTGEDTDTGYNSNKSNTYKDDKSGSLTLGNDMNLQDYYGTNYTTPAALYGTDRLTLLTNSGATLSEDDIIILKNFDNPNILVGTLGLGIGTIDDSKTFLETVADKKKIPGKGWGYTAGASYRGDGGYAGSLVLGGYDQARFTETDVTFNMPPTVNTSQLALRINRITAGTTGGGSSFTATTTSDGPIDPFKAVIDSTLPFLYLPERVLDVFVDGLGLRYDKTYDLYYLNTTQRAKNQDFNAITFELLDINDDSISQTIKVDYRAFDLQIGYPYYSSARPYFPIRKSKLPDTSVLGRSFLQEAYVVADYNKGTFKVGQALFPSKATQNVLPLEAATSPSSTPKPSSSSSDISGGAIAGIVIGVLAAVAILVGLVWFFFIRRKKRERSAKEAEIGPYTDVGGQANRRDTIGTVATYDSEQTARSELAALPSVRPPHSRNLSELSSESDLSRQKYGRTMSPPPIYELEDASDATQWAANERRMQERPSRSPNGRLTPGLPEESTLAPSESGMSTSMRGDESSTAPNGSASPPATEELSPMLQSSPNPSEGIVSPTSANTTSPYPILSPLSATAPEDAAQGHQPGRL